MQDLLQTLQDRDIGHLKVIAELWGIELPTVSSLETAKLLTNQLTHPEFIADLEESLPTPTKDLLLYILENEGMVLLPDLVRLFGEIREMGPGRRDRAKPWRDPISPVEDLWYRGLCAKTLVDTPGGAQEFLFIPDEIFKALASGGLKQTIRMGRPVSAPSEMVEADEHVVGDITTLLAYLRNSPPQVLQNWKQPPPGIVEYIHRPESVPLLILLLLELGIINPTSLEPLPAETKVLLELSNTELLNQLLDAWSGSLEWNDLAKLTHLSAANDEWPNDPLIGRAAVLEFLSQVPVGQWWDTRGFIADIHDSSPSFQRPAGDFDAWYLYRSADGKFLRGFQNWDHIEGDLIHYMLAGPLHWLGLVDIGKQPESNRLVAFRLAPLARGFLHGEQFVFQDPEESKISLLPDGQIRAGRTANRALRYQVARFTDWVSFRKGEFTYRITPHSLKNASEQGLGLEHIHSILNTACDSVPPAIKNALDRWEQKGTEAGIEKTSLLRVRDAAILDALMSNSRTAKFIIERLSPSSAIVNAKSQGDLYRAALRIGLFIDLSKDE
jgi:hypothetical protein